MKAENDILKQLQHKQRSVKDLADIISNMCDKHPNYTLMMGSGCSVTSGISTGQELVRQWKKEIYGEYSDGTMSEDEFWKQQYSWYDPRNEYSSLFEKKYDLPKQRRIFVEREVADKNPSIGYAYLVKLVENNFINTIFTTNFDDLINEAFYRYSYVRPIVCAHDSSITSITITSSRPKIIKLHGDYLYDDIKSTLRETESLNDNMKNKFIEFAKDHGLVVVGYAGNDRSIMDILTMLLQRPDYFKYGIYWCIRKGDIIGDELRKLLWKDRVYYVEIDGFDELMAELNDLLNNGELPIEGEMLSIKRQKKLIQDLTQNQYFKAGDLKNKIISKDIERLNKKIERNIIDDFFNALSKTKTSNSTPTRKSGLEDLTDEQRNKLDEISQLLDEHSYEKANKVMEEALLSANNRSSFKFNLLYLKLRLISRSKFSKVYVRGKIFDELIQMYPKREETYIDAFNSIPDLNVKFEYINKAINHYPQDTYLYNIKAEYLLDYLNNNLDKNNEVDIISETERTISKSITIKDTSTNKANILLCQYYCYVYSNDIKKRDEKIKDCYDKLEDGSWVKANIALRFNDILGISTEESENVMRTVQKYALESDDLELYERATISLLHFFDTKCMKEKINMEMSNYEQICNPTEDYFYIKAKLLISSLERPKDGEKLLIANKSKGERWTESLFNYYCDTRNEEKAKFVYNSYFPNDIEKEIRFVGTFGDNEKNIKEIEKYWQNHPKEITMLSSYVCSLFALKRYKEAYSMLKKYYDDPKYHDGVLYINYFIADINYNNRNDKEIKAKIQQKILNHEEQYDDIVLAGAYALTKDKGKMMVHLRKAIDKNILFKFDITGWPVFENYRGDKYFKELADTSGFNI